MGWKNQRCLILTLLVRHPIISRELRWKEGINPYYIAAFFNMLRSIGYWKLLSTYFNNQAGVNTETLKAVRILLPKKLFRTKLPRRF